MALRDRLLRCIDLVAIGGIVLQNSKFAGLKIPRENTQQRAIAIRRGLNHVTDVASEFFFKQ